MFRLPRVYSEVKDWKKPFHYSRTQLARGLLKILPNLEIIGITGSVGKTLTQKSIHAVLSQKFKVIVGNENLDPTFRIPKTILSAKPWHQKMILEYGIEKPNEMDFYLSIAKPKIAVVTVVAPTHLKYFKNIEGVLRNKTKLIEALDRDGHAVLNADDPVVFKMASATPAKIWWFGKRASRHSKNAVKISHFSQNLSGSKFRLHYMGQKASVSSKVIGEHQLTSAYAAATVGIICGLTLKQIAKGLSAVRPPKHRLNIVNTKNFSIIDDTYNSSPKAVVEAVNTFSDLGKRRQKIAVFSEMRDLGTFSSEAHKMIGEKIAKSKINYLFTVGKTASIIAKSAKRNGFGGKIISVLNTADAVDKIRKAVIKNSLIMVKGSRHAHLERIVNGLLGRSTYIRCYHCGELK